MDTYYVGKTYIRGEKERINEFTGKYYWSQQHDWYRTKAKC